MRKLTLVIFAAAILVANSLVAQQRTYKVKKGDWLSKISLKFYGSADTTAWLAIFKANRQITNPDRIYPGQVLVIPDLEAEAKLAQAKQEAGEIEAKIKRAEEQREQVAGHAECLKNIQVAWDEVRARTSALEDSVAWLSSELQYLDWRFSNESPRWKMASMMIWADWCSDFGETVGSKTYYAEEASAGVEHHNFHISAGSQSGAPMIATLRPYHLSLFSWVGISPTFFVIDDYVRLWVNKPGAVVTDVKPKYGVGASVILGYYESTHLRLDYYGWSARALRARDIDDAKNRQRLEAQGRLCGLPLDLFIHSYTAYDDQWNPQLIDWKVYLGRQVFTFQPDHLINQLELRLLIGAGQTDFHFDKTRNWGIFIRTELVAQSVSVSP